TSLTDTLGASTTFGPFNVGGPKSYTYTDTNGNPQSVTLTTGATTPFNPLGSSSCVNAPATPYNVNPVTAINYPDGTSFGIGWQPNTTKGGITGLINSVRLREGGTISYTYGAATTNCVGWGYSSLTRATPDGTTTY